MFLLSLLPWTKSFGQKWIEQNRIEQTQLDMGWKLLHGITLSHFTSSSCDFRGNLWILEFFNVLAELLDEQPGTAHTDPIALGYAPIKMELTQLLAAGNLMRRCLGKGKECNDRQQQELDDWQQGPQSSRLQIQCCFELLLMQVSAGRTSCC